MGVLKPGAARPFGGAESRSSASSSALTFDQQKELLQLQLEIEKA